MGKRWVSSGRRPRDRIRARKYEHKGGKNAKEKTFESHGDGNERTTDDPEWELRWKFLASKYEQSILVAQDGNVGIESIRANIESLEAKALHMFGFEAFIDVLYLAAQTLAVQTRFVWLQQTLAVQTRFVWLHKHWPSKRRHKQWNW